MKSDSSTVSVVPHESTYCEIFPLVRSLRAQWLNLTIPLLLAAVSAAWDFGLLVNSLFVIPVYMISVLALKMSRGFGKAIFAIMAIYLLSAVAMVAIVSFDWKDSAANVSFIIIGAFVIYWGIGPFKAGYRYAVSDNFTRMLVADLFEEPMFSWGSISKCLGLPFSIAHIRRSRPKILTYFIVSSYLYAVLSMAILFSPRVFSPL